MTGVAAEYLQKMSQGPRSPLARTMVSSKTSPAQVSAGAFRNGLQGLLGRKVAAKLTESTDMFVDARTGELNGNWSPNDATRKNHFLVEVSRAASAAMMNEKAGLPLIFLATQPIISWDYQWKILEEEIRQIPWAEVASGGIPRTSSYLRNVEEGGTSKFRQYLTIPSQTIVWSGTRSEVHTSGLQSPC